MQWSGDSTGNGTFVKENSSEKVNIAIPEEKGGSGQGFAPRELLGSSAGACFSMTLVSLMDIRSLPVDDFSMKTEGVNTGENFEITHYPKIVLSKDATDKDYTGVERAIPSADKRCTVGNVLKEAGVKIEIKPEISVG